MSKEFNFKTFVKDARITQKTIDVLVVTNFDEETVLEYLDASRISTLDISDGDAIRLTLALDKHFGRASALKPTISSVQVKTEPGATDTPLSAEATGPDVRPKIPTTTSLARDVQLNNLVAEFLKVNDHLAGFKDLLSLSDIQASAVGSLKGERPLLIGDFLSNNINVNYFQNEEAVQLSDETRLVLGKKKRPDVADYTPELWSGASFRIICHLITNGATVKEVQEYAEYSSMIADFLQIYVHRGVFALDFNHRQRVCKEGRSWADISGHDERMFLKHQSNPIVSSTNYKKGKNIRTKDTFQKKNVVLDSQGNPICFHYNGRGCSYGAKCIYSHVCLNTGCGQKHSQNACPTGSHI